MRPILITAVLVGMSGQASAADDARAAVLYEANLEAVSLSMHKAPTIKVSAQTQFRYDLNFRDDSSLGDDDTTIGFSMRTARVNLSGPVTDSIDAKVQIDFNRADGAARLQEGFADWTVNDGLKFRIGQQKVNFMRENIVGSARQLSANASVFDSVFGSGYAQLVEAWFTGDSWRGWVAFSDGFHSANTAFNSSREADYAFTGRFEFKLGDADWSAFDQFTSWRGSNSGALIGVGAHWQSRGNTNPAASPETDMFLATAGISWVSDGWNAHGEFVWRNTDAGSGADFDDYGFLLQGGLFVSDQAELFARYDFISPDSDRGPGVDDFGTLTAGLNYYIIPESHAAKFTLAVSYYFDAVDSTGGVVTPSDGLNLLADTEDGQFGITAQLQFLF